MTQESSDYLVFEGESGDNFVIPSIIQFLSLLNKSGKLSFTIDDNDIAYMFIYEGNLTHTELNKLGGVDVVSHMFCWNYGHGKFNFNSEYTGDRLLYKSLGKLVPQQILMRIMQRNDECPYKKDIHEKFANSKDIVTLDPSSISDDDRNDPIKGKMIQRLEQKEKVSLSELITDVFAGEMDSCKAFHELLISDAVINSSNWDIPLPQKHLLDIMNIISRFTDQSIALKFLADKKISLKLTSEDSVTVRKLKKLAAIARDDFIKLLPQAEQRWKELYTALNDYINKLNQ